MYKNSLTRRDVLRVGGLTLAALSPALRGADGFRSLFDGVSLKGWKRSPRALNQPSLGIWTVEDGIISGGQDPPGSGIGSYLVSEETFRRLRTQDRCPSRLAGGYGSPGADQCPGQYRIPGSSRPPPARWHRRILRQRTGRCHAWNYSFTAETDAAGKLKNLIPGPAAGTGNREFHRRLITPRRSRSSSRYGTPADGINSISVGRRDSAFTTWINGLKVAELDTAKMKAPKWDPKAVLIWSEETAISPLKCIAMARGDKLGKDRWAPGAVCRWRNISVKTL